MNKVVRVVKKCGTNQYLFGVSGGWFLPTWRYGSYADIYFAAFGVHGTDNAQVIWECDE